MPDIPGFSISVLRKRLLRRLLKKRFRIEDAEDAVQTALLRYVIHPPDITDEKKLLAWLGAVAYHELIDYYRENKNVLFLEDIEREPDTSEDCEALAVERMEITGALAILTPEERLLVEDYAKGCSCKELAEQLGITRDAAKKRLQRARKKANRYFLRHNV